MAKLAFIAFLFGLVEYGFHAALSCDKRNFCSDHCHYLQFLSELVQLYKSEPPVYKPAFTDVNKTKQDKTADKYDRKYVNTDMNFLQKKYDMEMKILSLQRGTTNIEKLLIKYDLVDIAQIINKVNSKMYYIR